MSFFEELKRRKVFRVGFAYGVTAWLLIQISDTVFPRIGLSESAVTLVIALLAIGFVPALIFAWAFDLTPEGIKRKRDIGRAEFIMPQTAPIRILYRSGMAQASLPVRSGPHLPFAVTGGAL